MNRKGQGAITIIIFFLILFTILIVGFIASMGVAIIDYGSDTITPLMTDLGMVGDVNLSQASDYTFGTVDSFVQALPWLMGFLYVVALLFSVIFVFAYGQNPSPVYLGFYIMLVVLLIFGSIIVSNMYQDIYTGNDEISSRLQEQTLSSYMILYSPFILTTIALLAGIYLFVKPSDEGGI